MAPRKLNSRSPLGPYSSKIIKAGALIGDTKTLLSQWDASIPTSLNIDRIQRENIFGKASRSRVRDILNIFRQRYLSEECVTRSLVALVKAKFPTDSMDRLLYLHSAHADRLLHDTVTQIIRPIHDRGIVDVGRPDIERALAKWVAEGKTTGVWSSYTITRTARGLLSTLRDFGVLQGADHKTIASLFLPIEAFAYIAFYLSTHQPVGSRMIELPDWGLFFLGRESVERLLFEAHQREYLQYHAAGSVARLTFPARSLEEYTRVIAPR